MDLSPELLLPDYPQSSSSNASDQYDTILEEFTQLFPDEGRAREAYRIIISLTYAFLVLCGLMANSLFCIVVLRCEKLHTVTHILMTNLAASNVVFLLFFPPYFMNTFIFESSWLFGTLLCKVCFSISYVTSTGSFYLMCLVAVDRWLAILMRKKRLDSKRCLLLTIFIWIIALFVASPYMYLAQPMSLSQNVSLSAGGSFVVTANLGEAQPVYRCGCYHPDHFMRMGLLLWTILIQYVIPLVIMVPAYGHLAYFVWSRPTVGVQTREKARKQTRRRKRLLATLLAIVGFLVACWLPLFIVNVVFQLQGHTSAQNKVDAYIYASMVTLLGVFATPICYLMNDVFRQETFELIAKFIPIRLRQEKAESAQNGGTRLLPVPTEGDLDESRMTISMRSSRRGTPVDLALLPDQTTVLVRDTSATIRNSP